MMRTKTKNESPHKLSGRLAACAVAFLVGWPVAAGAAWVVVASEPGKRVEIDRDSIVVEGSGTTARGRIALDKPIVDTRTGASYRVIEISNRFDCAERTHATLKRAYYKENSELLRQEEVRSPYDMPVRSGTPDDKLFREACRPGSNSAASTPAGKPATAAQAVEKVNDASAELRQLNESMIDKEVKKDVQRIAAKASAELGGHRPASAHAAPVRVRKDVALPAVPMVWSYEGAGGPDQWGRLRAEYAACGSGQRQSPIDLREGIAVDLEPIQFAYHAAPFKVIDSGRALLVMSQGGALSLLGKSYMLTQVLFHRPAETTVNGKTSDMEVQLLHRAADGQQAIVSVLLEPGTENPVIQTILNHVPLERGGEEASAGQVLDLERLLPEDRRYYAYMGSLTLPPCTENVLWLVFKTPQPISAAQLSIFQRLYRPNARPVQPGFGRIIKESR